MKNKNSGWQRLATVTGGGRTVELEPGDQLFIKGEYGGTYAPGTFPITIDSTVDSSLELSGIINSVVAGDSYATSGPVNIAGALNRLFIGNEGLKTVSDNTWLMATGGTLPTSYCADMFNQCTYLQGTPRLCKDVENATIIAGTSCFEEMFQLVRYDYLPLLDISKVIVPDDVQYAFKRMYNSTNIILR